MSPAPDIYQSKGEFSQAVDDYTNLLEHSTGMGETRPGCTSAVRCCANDAATRRGPPAILPLPGVTIVPSPTILRHA